VLDRLHEFTALLRKNGVRTSTAEVMDAVPANSISTFGGNPLSCAGALANLRYLLIETAFPDEEKVLAEVSKHLCPSMLASELRRLRLAPEIYISHLKPGQIELTMSEIEAAVSEFKPRMLRHGQVFEL